MLNSASQLLQLLQRLWVLFICLLPKKPQAPDLEARIDLPTKGDQGSRPSASATTTTPRSPSTPGGSASGHLEERPEFKPQPHSPSLIASLPKERLKNPNCYPQDISPPPIIYVEDWSSPKSPKGCSLGSGLPIKAPDINASHPNFSSTYEFSSDFSSVDPTGPILGRTRPRNSGRNHMAASKNALPVGLALTDISDLVKNKNGQGRTTPLDAFQSLYPLSWDPKQQSTASHTITSSKTITHHRGPLIQSAIIPLPRKPREKRQINCLRERASDKVNSTPKNHDEQASTTFPFREEINVLRDCNSELRRANGDHHTSNVSDAIVTLSRAQSGIRFHATAMKSHEVREPIDTPNNKHSIFHYTSAGITTSTETISTHLSIQPDFRLGDIPYPYVFDLNDYCQDPLPTRASITSCIFPTSISPWESENREASYLAISTPKKAFANLLLTSPPRVGASNAKCGGTYRGKDFFADATVLVYGYPSPPSEFDEEFRLEQESFAIFSIESGYSCSFTRFGLQNFGCSSASRKQLPEDEGTTFGTIPETPACGTCPTIPDTPGSIYAGTSPCDTNNERSPVCIQDDHYPEMNQTHSSPRSITAFTSVSHHIDAENHDCLHECESQGSPTLLAEGHSSGLTFAHRQYPRHWGLKNQFRPKYRGKAQWHVKGRTDDSLAPKDTKARMKPGKVSGLMLGLPWGHDGNTSEIWKRTPSSNHPVQSLPHKPDTGADFDTKYGFGFDLLATAKLVLGEIDCYGGFGSAKTPYPAPVASLCPKTQTEIGLGVGW